MTERLAHRSFVAATASIREARRFVCEAAAATGVTGTTLDDIELAASELVSNAVEHGVGDDFQVELSTDDGALVVEVTSSYGGSGLADPSEWITPSVESPTGRGLGLVRLLSADSWLHRANGLVTFGCRFDGA